MSKAGLDNRYRNEDDEISHKHDQIRNPNRIYPGQIFVLPMKAR